SMLSVASKINNDIAKALHKKTGEKYKGVLFGGFMATKNGVKLLEYNARFGDPEALNVLSILDGDLCEIFEAIIEERLREVPFRFRNQATVCKYIVPETYPNPSPRTEIDLSELLLLESDQLKIYLSAVDSERGKYYSTGSRAVACVGIGATLQAAEQIAEAAARTIGGPFRHRRDIGTKELIDRRKTHMDHVLAHSKRRAVARAS
ncbi:MAG: phosphoribosylamine--glycine ligase, partial [Chloroflexi bacterium]|nr:phosphoribosylamine--glycine ligase [Chloroflexota bacterium]